MPYLQPHKPRLDRRPIIRLGQYPPYVEPSPTDDSDLYISTQELLSGAAQYVPAIEGGPSETSQNRENAPADPTNLTRFVNRPVRYRAPRRRLEQHPPVPPPIGITPGNIFLGIGLNMDIIYVDADEGIEIERAEEPSGSRDNLSTDNSLRPPQVLGNGHPLTHSPEPLSHDLSNTRPRPSSTPAVIPENDLGFVEPDSDLPPGTVDAWDSSWDSSWDDLDVLDVTMMGSGDDIDGEARRMAMHLLRTGRLRLRGRQNEGADNAQMERDIAFHELEDARNRVRNRPPRSTAPRTMQGAVVIPPLLVRDDASEEHVRDVLAAHHFTAVTSSSADANARRVARRRRDGDAHADADAHPSELECLLPEETTEGIPQASSSQQPLSSPGVPVIPPSFSRVSTLADPRSSQEIPTSESRADDPVIPILPPPSALSPPTTPFPPPQDLIPRSPSLTPISSEHRVRASSIPDSSPLTSEPVWRNVSDRRPTPIPTIVHATDDEHEAIEQSQDHEGSRVQVVDAQEQTQRTEVGESSQTTLAETQTLPPCRELIESTARLDIAGVCFDPTGAYMYVATTDGITEWTVQGVERRWWGGGAYL